MFVFTTYSLAELIGSTIAARKDGVGTTEVIKIYQVRSGY